MRFSNIKAIAKYEMLLLTRTVRFWILCGFGFLLATVTTCLISWPLLLHSVKRIDFRIFASQPIDTVVKVQRNNVWRKINFSSILPPKQMNKNEKSYTEYHN